MLAKKMEDQKFYMTITAVVAIVAVVGLIMMFGLKKPLGEEVVGEGGEVLSDSDIEGFLPSGDKPGVGEVAPEDVAPRDEGGVFADPLVAPELSLPFDEKRDPSIDEELAPPGTGERFVQPPPGAEENESDEPQI